MMRTQIPAFRLPAEVLDEEVEYITDMGVHTYYNHYVSSMKEMLEKDFDAVFVGTGAPRGRELNLPGSEEGRENIIILIEFFANVLFENYIELVVKVICIVC